MALGNFDFCLLETGEAVFMDWPCVDFGPENVHSVLDLIELEFLVRPTPMQKTGASSRG